MPLELLTQFLKLPVFMLVVARLAGMIMWQPVLTALAIPPLVRVILLLGLGALVLPFVPVTGAVPDTLFGLVIAMGEEVLLGGMIGLVVAIVFAGVQMGAELVAQESGLSFGQMVDPSTNQILSVLSSFYTQLAGVVYLIVGGHRVLLAACLDTFRTVPLAGYPGVASIGTGMLVEVLAAGTTLAIRVAAPALLTLFLVNMALGFISRTVPQIDIATMGFSLKALIGFVVMAIAIPSALGAFTDTLELSLGWLAQLVGN
jgi:flagellar biosynthetic protein FliR